MAGTGRVSDLAPHTHSATPSPPSSLSRYTNTGQTDIIPFNLEKDMLTWRRTFNKPVMMTEYGCDAVAGLHSDPPFAFTEEFQVEYISQYFGTFDKLRAARFFVGEMVWNFADFLTAQGITRVHGNKKGMFTRQRQPKMAAHALRSRYNALANATRLYPLRLAALAEVAVVPVEARALPAAPSRPRPRPYGRQPQDGSSVRGSAATRRRSADFLGIRGREFYAPRPAAAAPHRTVASGAPRPPRQKAGAQTAANTHPNPLTLPSPSLSVAGTAGAADGRQGGGDARDASVDAAAAEARVAAARRRRLRLGRPPRRLGGEPAHRGRAPLQRRHRPVGRRPRHRRAGARRRRRRAAAYGGQCSGR